MKKIINKKVTKYCNICYQNGIAEGKRQEKDIKAGHLAGHYITGKKEGINQEFRRILDLLIEIETRDKFETFITKWNSLKKQFQIKEISNEIENVKINPIQVEPLKLTGKDREHKIWTTLYETCDEDCSGEVYWDEGLEGYVCTKCELYTGVK